MLRHDRMNLYFEIFIYEIDFHLFIYSFVRFFCTKIRVDSINFFLNILQCTAALVWYFFFTNRCLNCIPVYIPFYFIHPNRWKCTYNLLFLFFFFHRLRIRRYCVIVRRSTYIRCLNDDFFCLFFCFNVEIFVVSS